MLLLGEGLEAPPGEGAVSLFFRVLSTYLCMLLCPTRPICGWPFPEYHCSLKDVGFLSRGLGPSAI